ncbi:MAG TPA: hypothetical protein VNL71_19760 [Chloroflexota bacterium]|nr:hypothetical protein [Chloroflexota bacterium]
MTTAVLADVEAWLELARGMGEGSVAAVLHGAALEDQAAVVSAAIERITMTREKEPEIAWRPWVGRLRDAARRLKEEPMNDKPRIYRVVRGYYEMLGGGGCMNACPPWWSVSPRCRTRGGPRGRHPLVVTLWGYQSYMAMAEWGRTSGAKVGRALGFSRERTGEVSGESV